MGIKKMFQKKEPTEQEIREELSRVGISTRSNNTRQEKFGAFKNYAQERANMKPQLGPVGGNPYANINPGTNNSNNNPYASDNGNNSTGNPNNNGNGNGNNGGNPYGGGATNNNNPYGGSGGNGRGSSPSPYASTTSTTTRSSNPYGNNNGSRSSQNTSSPYAKSTNNSSYSNSPYSGSTVNNGNRGGHSNNSNSSAGSNPYAAGGRSSQSQNSRDNVYTASATRTSTRQTQGYGGGDTDSTLDLNAIPSHQMFDNKKPIKRNQQSSQQPANDYNLDLNDEYGEEEDLNLDISEVPEEQQQINSEDEEVEAIKQDIKFVKQESVQSTRNTLRMAQEADASGTNTLGMLGSQLERLYNAEQNLLLAETQTQIADEKVKELKRLNRSIFIPANGNPFNKKSRLRQQEEKIKNQKLQEKYIRENNRQEMFASEQRIKQGITNNSTNNDVYNKYQDEKNLSAAKRYQFENDSEDDDMEKEIALNLNQIDQYAKKLKGLVNTMGTEVDNQNTRLKKIEESADKLDINVHMNTTRLNNIR